MKSTLKYASRTAAGMLSAALLAGLGLPLLAAAFALAVLVLGVTCWIINSGDRSDRVTRMIFARSGDASCLAPASPAAPAPVSSRRRRGGRHAAARAER